MGERQGTFGEYLRNWHKHEGPVAEKVRLTLRNSWLRVRNAGLCCGHPGEPGC